MKRSSTAWAKKPEPLKNAFANSERVTVGGRAMVLASTMEEWLLPLRGNRCRTAIDSTVARMADDRFAPGV